MTKEALMYINLLCRNAPAPDEVRSRGFCCRDCAVPGTKWNEVKGLLSPIPKTPRDIRNFLPSLALIGLDFCAPDEVRSMPRMSTKYEVGDFSVEIAPDEVRSRGLPRMSI